MEKITRESETTWAPLSKVVLERLLQETGDYEQCTHALLFALGRLATRKEPDLAKLERGIREDGIEGILFAMMQGAAYQVTIGHGSNGGIVLEKES